MKKLIKLIITKILVFKAKRYLKRHRTQVIAITGSVGKTSAKEAIYHILKKHFKTYRSPGGFNTEIGISLAILQEEESGFSSIFSWLRILNRVFFKPKKPFEKIILEMGADCPGDIKKLTKIAKPKIGIITNVNPVHLGEGQFRDINDIAKEKNNLIKNMPPECVAILNYDDELVREMKTGARKIGFGLNPDADILAGEIEAKSKYIKFRVSFKDQSAYFKVPIIGEFQVYTLLPAIAVGLKLGLSMEDCARNLEDFHLPPGRMNYIEGLNDSDIIDGSYNASPVSMERALDLLNILKGGRKIAALGTMNELGELTKEAHLSLGRKAASVSDILIAVGQEAATVKQGALESGMKEENIYTFFDSEEAGYFLAKYIQAKDLILVKGSQNRVRMEKLVKIIMKKPENAGSLLCRQGEAWNNI